MTTYPYAVTMTYTRTETIRAADANAAADIMRAGLTADQRKRATIDVHFDSVGYLLEQAPDSLDAMAVFVDEMQRGQRDWVFDPRVSKFIVDNLDEVISMRDALGALSPEARMLRTSTARNRLQAEVGQI